MSKLKRYFAAGNTYFLTLVSRDRKPLLIGFHDLLEESLYAFADSLAVSIVAHIILPDHVHLVIEPHRSDPAAFVQRVKLSFSKKVRYRMNLDGGRIWQSRYWDHVIRDQNDLKRHIDYIHYNPVKHGLTDNPFAWPHSSIHAYHRRGVYGDDWGVIQTVHFDGDFGE